MRYYKAAQAASFECCHSGAGRNPEYNCALVAYLCAPRPAPPVDIPPSNICNPAAIRPSASERVRVHPGNFSFYFSLTYHQCPGGPGDNQHTHAHARARACVFQLLLSDLLFILKLKVPGLLGHTFNIIYFRSDIHPDALGLPGRTINGGIQPCH